jgi:FG-GAP-like repeat/HYR domain
MRLIEIKIRLPIYAQFIQNQIKFIMKKNTKSDFKMENLYCFSKGMTLRSLIVLLGMLFISQNAYSQNNVNYIEDKTWPQDGRWGVTGYTWAADFNRDGIPDIASANGENVFMKLSNGDGFKNETWTQDGLWGPADFTWVADFNKDGKADIASANKGNVHMKLSNGTGFKSETWPQNGDWGYGAYTWVADFNGDGIPDIASAYNKNVFMKLSSGTGFKGETWSQDGLWGPAGFTWVADFNNDGMADIASANEKNVFMKLSTGTGFKSETWAQDGSWGPAGYPRVADFNGDGIPDIASAYNENVFMKLSTGTGFKSETWAQDGLWGDAGYTWVADFNKDGKADIASANKGNVHIKLSNGKGFRSESWPQDGRWGAAAFTWVADFNGDGMVDIASAYKENVFMKLIKNNINLIKPESWAQDDSIPLNFVNGFDFEGKTRNITFDKGGCPLDYHYISQPDPQITDPLKINKHRWQHLQHMIRLPDADGIQYYMGTYSQNVAGGEACGDQNSLISNSGYSDQANEGGIVFVAKLIPGNTRGQVIWWDILNNAHPAGGFNHPGDLRRVGNTVIIAGQNWCPTSDKFNNLFDGGSWENFFKSAGKALAYPFKRGNGGQAVLFYDVSKPNVPAYMGKMNACIDVNGKKYEATNDIDELTAAKVGEYYYLWFNGYGKSGLACRSKTFRPHDNWELIKVVNDNGLSSISFLQEGKLYSGVAEVRGGYVRYDRLKFMNNGKWEYRLNELSDSIGREISILPKAFPGLAKDNWVKPGFSVNSLSDGRSSVVISNVESDGQIEIVETESDNQYIPPITDVFLAYGTGAVPEGYTRIEKDLNRGADGDDIFLWYKRDPCKSPITAFKIQINSRITPPKYMPVSSNMCGNEPCDLNRGTNSGATDPNKGDYIFMYYSTDKEEGVPISDLDIMWQPGKGNFFELAIGTIKDDFESMAKVFTEFDIEKPIGFVFNVGKAMIPIELALVADLSSILNGPGNIENAPSQWYRDPNDLNKGAGGYDIYLSYSRTNGISTSFLKCPPNIVINNTPGKSGAHVTLSMPKFRPDCPIESGAVTITPASGAFFPIGSTTVTCRGKDYWNPQNPLHTCKFTVTVQDVEKPRITCPAIGTISCETSTAPNTTGFADATDNFTLEPLTYVDATTAGDCTAELIIIRSWTARDINGNTSSCTQKIIVKDEIAPTINCPAHITVSSDTTVTATGMVTAKDNCDPSLDFSRHDVFASGYCDWYCIVERHFQAIDDCGNSSKCTQIITRNTAPTIETILPITIGMSNSTLTIPVGRADCIIQWLPHTGTVPTGLAFKKATVDLDCKPGTNPLDANGKPANPLLVEALKLHIFVGLKPSLGTTKISALSNCVDKTVMSYLSPDPDIKELLRVTNLALGNSAVQPHLKELLAVLKCINAPLNLHSQ